jgi:hypothetical protein
LACGPRTGRRAPLRLGGGGGVRGGDGPSSRMVRGSHPSAAQGAEAGSGCGGKQAGWAASSSGWAVAACGATGLLRGWSGLRGWLRCWAVQAGGLDGGKG